MRVQVIRDAVHRYIPFSSLEKKIMASSLFIRLYYVTQNGLAYMTYPSNRTSRFAHCLGTMHVGTQMLLGAITTSKSGRAFLNASKRALAGMMTERFESGDVGYALDRATAWLHDNPDPFYQSLGLTASSRDIWTIILVQSLRLACIVHDLGHPPFSHTLEAALECHASYRHSKSKLRKNFDQAVAFLRNRSPGSGLKNPRFHELCGAVLANRIFADIFREGGERRFFKACLSIATGVVVTDFRNAATKQDRILAALHEIVSGPVDADRADYVLRDGGAFGLEAVNYDLLRIVGNMQVGREGGSVKPFVFRPTCQAASGIEGFFHARYRLYRWAIYRLCPEFCGKVDSAFSPAKP
jgi:hypothetical protein